MADVMLLGGASILVFFILQTISVTEEILSTLAATMFMLAHLVNHPHFAHSYQIFYSGWHQLQQPGVDPALRRRWWFVGAWVPALLIAGLSAAYVAALDGNQSWIGAALSLMALLVGWHYVKQGFGMVMLDAALRRRFFSAPQRNSLIVNAYACWFCAWALIADLHSGTVLFGYMRLGFDIPDGVVIAACLLALVTSCYAGLNVFRAVLGWRVQGAQWNEIPVAGILAYVVTLYLWTIFSWVNLAYALIIPFFHSLQYLTVVWRYKRNELAVNVPIWRSWPCIRFLVGGIVLGASGFWAIPGTVEWVRTGHLPQNMQHAAPTLVCAWILINVHHYFIDSVLWRQGNPNVSRHLFGREPPRT